MNFKLLAIFSSICISFMANAQIGVKPVETNQKITPEISLSLKAKYSEYKHIYARFETNLGEIVAELYPQNAPFTVDNFIGLAEGTKRFIDIKDPKLKEITKRFYDGLTFHRIAPNFVIQGGCPKGNGTGGPGYVFDDELNNGLNFNNPGMLAMANSGPDSNGSQFFITLRRTDKVLGDNYTIFGKVTEGMDVVKKIEQIPTYPNERPRKKVVIKKVSIEKVK